jgi:hypothetical protein
MKDVLLAYFKIVQEGHQPGVVGDVIEYPIHLGNKYVELGILSICNELGEDILPDAQLDHTLVGDWSPTGEGK